MVPRSHSPFISDLVSIHDCTNEQNKLAIKTFFSEQILKKVHMTLTISKLRIT